MCLLNLVTYSSIGSRQLDSFLNPEWSMMSELTDRLYLEEKYSQRVIRRLGNQPEVASGIEAKLAVIRKKAVEQAIQQLKKKSNQA